MNNYQKAGQDVIMHELSRSASDVEEIKSLVSKFVDDADVKRRLRAGMDATHQALIAAFALVKSYQRYLDDDDVEEPRGSTKIVDDELDLPEEEVEETPSEDDEEYDDEL